MGEHATMDRLIKEHIGAEIRGDSSGAVAMYTSDVEHDVVGWPTGPVQGQQQAQAFYEQLMSVFTTQEMKPLRTLYGDDFCVIEHWATGLFPSGFLGAPASQQPTSFRMLHVFEFRHDAISRENVWLDIGAILGQLNSEGQARPLTTGS